ncbi:MAG: recombinase family protein, partial [Butyrivibrio sp.]|nr:recombinase family protein [Butyrivibrio sp.]
FDKIYSEFTDAEKKRFINAFVEKVEIYEEEQENGRFLKSIKFRFPIYYNGTETQEIDLSDSGWDYQKSLETVVLLTKTTVREV